MLLWDRVTDLGLSPTPLLSYYTEIHLTFPHNDLPLGHLWQEPMSLGIKQRELESWQQVWEWDGSPSWALKPGQTPSPKPCKAHHEGITISCVQACDSNKRMHTCSLVYKHGQMLVTKQYYKIFMRYITEYHLNTPCYRICFWLLAFMLLVTWMLQVTSLEILFHRRQLL